MPKRKSRSKKRKERSAAIVTIHDAPNMTPKGARDIAAWLERTAKMLRDGEARKVLAGRFRARYLYTS